MGAIGNRRQGRLAGLVREHRRRAGMTQVEAAEQAGLSVAGLRDLEQGRVSSPRPATLRRLATALALSDSQAEELLLQATQPAGPAVLVRVLGPLEVVIDGAAVDPGSSTQRILLALLSLSAGTPVSRDALVDAAWGGQPASNASDLLQTHISRLRRRLRPRHGGEVADPLLVATGGGYRLTLSGDQLDLLTFRRLVDEARRAHRESDHINARDLFQRAANLWRGDPLGDLPALHAHPAVVSLTREWQTAILEFASVAGELGSYEDILPHLERLAEMEPMHEAAHAQLMIALAGTGQQAAALDTYEQLRRRLADELGADPGPELGSAHQQVLRQEITRSESAPVGARRQLPPDISEFTGRESELTLLREQLPRADDVGTAIVISAIEGMAGVGKTRLAVHLAHQLVAAGRYADCQLYVDLRGHAEQPPADPATVLASFLQLLGVPGSQIPQDLDARAALYRDQLHDEQALILLDNAATEDQIRPLLPASPTNLTLVTSRRSLAVDGAASIQLDVFTWTEAEALLEHIAGAHRVMAEPEATRQVIDLCGRLPLAVALAGRRLQTRPQWSLGDLAARLEETGARLDELTAGRRQLRAVFDLSYQALSPDLAAVFRLLGLHPGDDFTVESAAPLTDHPPRDTRRLLDQLVDEHLLTMSSFDRYRLHDLLRDYATEQFTHGSEREARDAIQRLLQWYLYAADTAAQMLFPHLADITLDDAERPGRLPVFRTEEDAFRWLTAEHSNLMAAATSALEHGFFHIAWQLPIVLKHYLERRSMFDDSINMSRLGLTAARRAGDQAGEASALGLLGMAYGQLDDTERSVDYLAQALLIRRALGGDESRRSEARILNNLGVAYGRRQEFNEALRCLREALNLSRSFGDHYLETRVLSNLGLTHTRLNQPAEAIEALSEVLEVSQRSNDPVGMVAALHNLGEALLRAGEPGDAISYLRRALDIYRHKHFRLYEAEVLNMLGEAFQETHQPDEALGCWNQALAILDQVGHPLAKEVRLRIERSAHDATAD